MTVVKLNRYKQCENPGSVCVCVCLIIITTNSHQPPLNRRAWLIADEYLWSKPSPKCMQTRNFSWCILYLMINTSIFVMSFLTSVPSSRGCFRRRRRQWKKKRSALLRGGKKGPRWVTASCFIFYLHTNEDINLFRCFPRATEHHWRNMLSASGSALGSSPWRRGKTNEFARVKREIDDTRLFDSVRLPLSFRFFSSTLRKLPAAPADDKWLGVEKWDVLIFLIYDLDASNHLL